MLTLPPNQDNIMGIFSKNKDYLVGQTFCWRDKNGHSNIHTETCRIQALTEAEAIGKFVVHLSGYEWYKIVYSSSGLMCGEWKSIEVLGAQ